MTSSTDQTTKPGKSGIWRRIVERYHWMSLWNKVGLWAFIIVGTILVVNAKWFQPEYRLIKMKIYLRTAEADVAKKDYPGAVEAYRKALLSGQEHVEAWLSLAKFLEQVGSPEIVNVWERVASMSPPSQAAAYHSKAALAAFRFGRFYEADQLLAKVPLNEQGSEDYLRASAALALNKNDLVYAQQALDKLRSMDRKDSNAAFELLLLQLKSGDPSAIEAAKTELEQLGDSDHPVAADALRQLIKMALDSDDPAEADRLATKLITKPDSTFDDRIQFIKLEIQTNSLSLMDSITALRAYGQQHPEVFEQVVSILVASKVDPAGTDLWIKGLPASLKDKPEVKAGLLRYYLGLSDWDHAFDVLRSEEKAAHIPPDVIDFAQKAVRADIADDSSAEQLWMKALYAADGNPPALQALSAIASARGWSVATGLALKSLTQAAPEQSTAWKMLVEHERSAGNLEGVYSALAGLKEINPYDIPTISQWVIASVLLRKGTGDAILDAAKRAYYSTDPANADAGTAYAVALMEAGHTSEALEVVERMSIKDRRDLDRAIYIGAVYAAAGEKSEALDYFKRSEDLGTAKFPEEKALRRIWKDVALGGAMTTDEAKRLLAKRADEEREAEKIDRELHQQLERRSDPAEVQQILEGLKSETEKRNKTPVDISKLLHQADEQ
jgi:tetratricopeptide (TPR) repeat protein